MMKKTMEEKYDSLPDNTEFKDEKTNLKFAKLNLPASVVDFLLEHYGFTDLVELNSMALYILKSIGLMEQDGFKIVAYRQVNEKPEAFELNILDLIAKFRVGLQSAQKVDKPYEPKIETKESNV